MLHRAILGSFERFLGILIEHYAGRFPLWLAPVQAVVATIVSDADDYAREVAAALRTAGLQVELDLPNQKINAKVREHSLAHVPVLAVVGRKEAEDAHGGAAPAGRPGAGGAAAGRGGAALAAEATPPDLRERVHGPPVEPDRPRRAPWHTRPLLDPQRIDRPDWPPAIVNHDRRRP